MAIKLTKNEQKVQKDRLKQYQRYLPTLQLKKQQLQAVITKTKADLDQKEVERAQMIGRKDGARQLRDRFCFAFDVRALIQQIGRAHV